VGTPGHHRTPQAGLPPGRQDIFLGLGRGGGDGPGGPRGLSPLRSPPGPAAGPPGGITRDGPAAVFGLYPAMRCDRLPSEAAHGGNGVSPSPASLAGEWGRAGCHGVGAGPGGGDPGPKRPWGPPGGATRRGALVVGGGGPPKTFVSVGGWSSVPGVRVFPLGQQHMPTPPEYRRSPGGDAGHVSGRPRWGEGDAPVGGAPARRGSNTIMSENLINNNNLIKNKDGVQKEAANTGMDDNGTCPDRRDNDSLCGNVPVLTQEPNKEGVPLEDF